MNAVLSVCLIDRGCDQYDGAWSLARDCCSPFMELLSKKRSWCHRILLLYNSHELQDEFEFSAFLTIPGDE